MKKFIIFNWKMNPSSLKEAKRLFGETLKAKSYKLKDDIVIAPPFVYLSVLSSVIGHKSLVKLASQDLFWEDQGAYTGEISAKMLKNLGVEYVIIGHSERRQIIGETDEMINKKVLAGLKAGLKVILCVGELKRSVKYQVSSVKAAKNYVKNQLQKDLKNLSLNSKFYILNSHLIIAYEPIWAIGTDKPCHPEDVLEMIKFIKQTLKAKSYKLKAKVLYGGSVNGKNIKDFVKYGEINGVLVGGASLKKKEIKGILKSI